MPLDHFVSQVYLKNFSDPEDGQLYAIKKSDLEEFRCRPKDVCRVQEGSTNEFLNDPRAVEEFLKEIEPDWNKAVAQLGEQALNHNGIVTIAGMVAYITSCSPTGMRMHSEPLQKQVELVAKSLDASGQIPKPPPELEGESLTELIENGKIRVAIDEKFPQAIGISQILGLTENFGNMHWEILINEQGDSPFLTSDFPVAVEHVGDNVPINRIFPILPKLAIRMIPKRLEVSKHDDLRFKQFSSSQKKLHAGEVRSCNQLIVRSAENLVFHHKKLGWFRRFVERNRHFRVEAVTETIPAPTGNLLMSQTKIVRYYPSNEKQNNSCA